MEPNQSDKGILPSQNINDTSEQYPEAESAAKQLIAKLKLIADNLEEVIWQSTPVNTEPNSSNTSSGTATKDSFLHSNQNENEIDTISKNFTEPLSNNKKTTDLESSRLNDGLSSNSKKLIEELANSSNNLTEHEFVSEKNKSPIAGPSKANGNNQESPAVQFNRQGPLVEDRNPYFEIDDARTPDEHRISLGRVFKVEYTPPRPPIHPVAVPKCILNSVPSPIVLNKKIKDRVPGGQDILRRPKAKLKMSPSILKRKLIFENSDKDNGCINEDRSKSPIPGTSGDNEHYDENFTPVCTCDPIEDDAENSTDVLSDEPFSHSSIEVEKKDETHKKCLDKLDEHISLKDTPGETEDAEKDTPCIKEIFANKILATAGPVNSIEPASDNLPLPGSSAISSIRKACLGKSSGSDRHFETFNNYPVSITQTLLSHNLESEESEEESKSCTCPSYSDSEEDVAGGEYKEDEDVPVTGVSDGEGQCQSPDRNKRKRKADSPSYGSLKKNCFDPINSNVPEINADNPPDVLAWVESFLSWSGSKRLHAIDLLIKRCAADQVLHMMHAIEPLFQRDFISLLPRELALSVLGFLEPKDLLRAAQTCRYWRFLADDNLLWKEQCQRVGIVALRRRPRTMPVTTGPWKAAYMRQRTIENNWLNKSMANFKVLKGHDDHVITCLQFYGNKILSGSDDTTLKVWSAVSGKCLHTLVGHTGGVWSSQMIARTIISGSTDRTLRVWDAETGKCLRTLVGHTSTVRCMHLFNDRVVSGSRDATLRVWSVPDGRCLKVLVGHMAAVRCVQYDGRLVVSGAYDYFVKVWNPETAECLHTLAGHTNRVYSLQFDGVHVVSGSLDTSIMVWDVETGAQKHTLMGHQSLTSGMELRSNILVSGNADSTVKIWDIISGQCLHTLSGPCKHQSAVTCLQTNSRFVITSSDDGTVKLWDVRTGEFIRNLVSLGSGGSGGVVWRIRSSATKLVCAVGSRNGTEETKLLVLDFDVPGACVKCEE